MIKVAVAAAILLIPLAGSCGNTPTEDRNVGNGINPDTYADATHVVVYRNADTVPNIAVFCLGNYGFASTLKNPNETSSNSVAVIRFQEYDQVCKGG